MPVFHDVELESPFSPSVPGWLAEEYAVVDSGAATQSIKVPKWLKKLFGGGGGDGVNLHDSCCEKEEDMQRLQCELEGKEFDRSRFGCVYIGSGCSPTGPAPCKDPGRG